MDTGKTTTIMTVLLLLLMARGCGTPFYPDVIVQPPAPVAHVLGHLPAFEEDVAGAFARVAPATVMDDLTALDGCWASARIRNVFGTEAGPFIVYQFNARERTFTRWTGIATGAGVLWPAVPLLSAESGPYEVNGPALLLMTDERHFANTDPETGEITSDLHEDPEWQTQSTRPALVTLSGDRMLLYIDARTESEADDEQMLAVFTRFECDGAAR
jgi:hypothetical protein